MPWEQFEKNFHYGIARYPHFRVSSETSVKEDILQADIVIYWGSTVGLEAQCMGRPVINYLSRAVVNFDPLFQFHDFKWTVADQDDLGRVIEEILALSDQDFSCRQQAGLAYLKKYFYPVTNASIDLFLSSRSMGGYK
jgi:hypothetical protein